MKSPCIGRCSCTLGDDVCRGCFRTADEVRDWNGYTMKQKKRAVRDALFRRIDRRISDTARKFGGIQ